MIGDGEHTDPSVLREPAQKKSCYCINYGKDSVSIAAVHREPVSRRSLVLLAEV